MGECLHHSTYAKMFLMDFLFSILGVLLSVAFFTLTERKIMGLMHFRKGPNKVLVWGLSQPIADALKLLTKEFPKFTNQKMWMFYLGPCVSILLMTLCWGWYEASFTFNFCSMKLLVIFSIMSLTAYSFLLMSWGSNSKYALIGGYRAVAQIISYEVCLVLFILIFIYVSKTMSLEKIKISQTSVWFMVYSIPCGMTWLMLCMAEANRTPFDLAEGESEIVSGFNIEYGGGLFAFIFISEYGMIIFMSFITAMMFMGATHILMKTFFICLVFVWVRCSFPRVRYNNLMMMAWKLALPYSLVMVLTTSSLT